MYGVALFLRSRESMQVYHAVRSFRFRRVVPNDPRLVVGLHLVLRFIRSDKVFKFGRLLRYSWQVFTPFVLMWRWAKEINSNQENNRECNEDGFAAHVPGEFS